MYSQYHICHLFVLKIKDKFIFLTSETDLPWDYFRPSSKSLIIRITNSRSVRWAGHVACMGVMINASKILVRNPKGRRPCRRTWHRWEDNIRMDLREIGWEVVNWIHLPLDGNK